MSVATEKDLAERTAMAAVGSAIAALNDAVRESMRLKIKVEIGAVMGAGDNKKVAKNWYELWNDDGLAVRFTREEIAVAPKPAPPIEDAQPKIGAEDDPYS